MDELMRAQTATSRKSVVKKPAAKPPAKKPAAKQKPAAKKPAAKPPAKKPAAKPAAKKPAAKSAAKKPAAPIGRARQVFYGSGSHHQDLERFCPEAALQCVLEAYVADTSTAAPPYLCKCYRGVNSQPGKKSAEPCCTQAVRELSDVVVALDNEMDWWQMEDGDEVNAMIHRVAGACSFVLPHVKGSLAYKKFDLRPLLDHLENLSSWVDGCYDENPLQTWIGFLTKPGFMDSPPMVAPRPAAKKKKGK